MNYQYNEFELYINKEDGSFLVHATFPLMEEGIVNIDHTYVAPELRGQGIASEMMHAVMKHLEKKHVKVVATCPYAVVWLKKHKEYDHMIDHALSEHLGPECKI